MRLPPTQTGFDQLARDRVTALHPSTFVIRRSALDDIGLVYEEIPGSYGEDYDLLLRGLSVFGLPVLAVRQPLVDVLWHEQSFFAERWQTISDALRYMLAKYPELTSGPGARGQDRRSDRLRRGCAGPAPRSMPVQLAGPRGNPAEGRAYLALAVAAA